MSKLKILGFNPLLSLRGGRRSHLITFMWEKPDKLPGRIVFGFMFLFELSISFVKHDDVVIVDNTPVVDETAKKLLLLLRKNKGRMDVFLAGKKLKLRKSEIEAACKVLGAEIENDIIFSNGK